MTEAIRDTTAHLWRLYGRSYCHLCTDMAEQLRAYTKDRGVVFVEIDVDSDPALEARFGELVPVLTNSADEEICHYFLDLDAVQRQLELK